jgi:hypothetical protein
MSFLNKDNIVRKCGKKIQLKNFKLEWV